MAPEVTKDSSAEEENKRSFDREIKEMASTLTQRLDDLHSTGKHGLSGRNEDDEDRGRRIITLAGNNSGATMKADFGEKLESSLEHEMMGACVNSNFQAVNNAIMLNGNCCANDPGVHLVITDYVEKHGLGDEHEDDDDKKEKKKSEKNDEKSEKGTDAIPKKISNDEA